MIFLGTCAVTSILPHEFGKRRHVPVHDRVIGYGNEFCVYKMHQLCRASQHGMFSVSVLPLNPINQFFHLYSFVDLSFLWPSQGKLFDHLITNLVVGSKQGKDRICILAGSAGGRLPEFCQSLLYLLCLQNRVATTFPDCRVYRSGNFNYRILWPSLAECLRLGGAGLVDDNQCSKLTPNVNIWTVWIDPIGHTERSLYDFPRSFVQIPSNPINPRWSSFCGNNCTSNPKCVAKSPKKHWLTEDRGVTLSQYIPASKMEPS